MSFVKQSAGDNKCGAFSIAYWEWIHFNGRDPKNGAYMPGDMEIVDKIYDKIQFIKNLAGVPAGLPNYFAFFSDPRLMIDYIREKTQYKETIMINSDPNLQAAYGADFAGYCNYLNQLPDLAPGKYAILILSNNNLPQHYVLAEGVTGGIRITDPATGNREELPAEYNIRNVTTGNLTNSGVAIYIR